MIPMDERKLTIVGHLSELRKRIIIVILAIVIGSITCYSYVDQIVTLIIQPAQDLNFIYLNPADLFLAYVKVSIISGIILASPVIFYQVWRFAVPGVAWKQRLAIILVICMSLFFFVAGATFAYTVIIPFTLAFFTQIARDEVAPLFSFSSYAGFIGSLVLSFGLAFQLPILIMLLTQVNLLNPRVLKKFRKYFILIILIVAAILTPPDVISQCLLAIPMIFLFELSVLISSMIYRRKKRQVMNAS